MMPRLCECCQLYWETEVYGPVAICRSCYGKIDARFFEMQREAANQQALASLRANAKEQVEIEKLETWWKLDGSWIDEGRIYR